MYNVMLMFDVCLQPPVVNSEPWICYLC